MIVRARFRVAGGHTHVRVFASMYAEGALGKAGDLTFRNEEWELIAQSLTRAGWQVVDEAAAVPEGGNDRE